MAKNRGLTRRQFLVIICTWVAGTGLSQLGRRLGFLKHKTERLEPSSETYLPLVLSDSGEDPPIDSSRVVHVQSTDATNWDFTSGWYGDYVDQDEVYQMVDQGLLLLTGATTRAEAWLNLVPNYVPDQKVAIKINLNNAKSIDDSDNVIDALIQPVNAVIRGLLEIGVAASDIWVYDAKRWIPDRLINGCDFPGVQFSGYKGPNSLGFSETETVNFETPSGLPSLDTQRISNVLVNAEYLINVPIMKRHGIARVTLSFKNHLGSVEAPVDLHEYIKPSSSIYTDGYNPMLDIYMNQNFRNKTILTIGDGLFGCWRNNYSEPKPWVTFNHQAPNSLFFSKDPVALDCVLYDFLDAEVGVLAGGDDHLVLAAQELLGVFEHRAPGVSNPEEWYSLIDYKYLNLD